MINQFPGYGMRIHPQFPQHQHPQQHHPPLQQHQPPLQQEQQHMELSRGPEGAESDDLSATENSGPNTNQFHRQQQPQFPGFNMQQQQPGYYPVGPYLPHQPPLHYPVRPPMYMYYDEGGRGGVGGGGRRGGGRRGGGGRTRRGGGRGGRGSGRYNHQGYIDSDRSLNEPDVPPDYQQQQHLQQDGMVPPADGSSIVDG